ncbi:hypothetical protein MNQ98_17335 [Paenibacillus sp. N3/727]|uniref:hypothetical protein n=1 Tax=Paenibacillus sp. N3/727 TaxID=2925845 RepID=UPI001F53A928|nr:hypothetical protein [Paenibacillus sp. N3/727]UNK16283.1 hypothetical protein MNQ98_17335 [Paenibacillus sp. N3/727]
MLNYLNFGGKYGSIKIFHGKMSEIWLSSRTKKGIRAGISVNSPHRSIVISL